jgi:hypothetical protein
MLYWILLLHVLSGTMALVLGSVVIALKKGTLIHRRLGNVFWWALAISVAASVPIAYIHQRAFLLLIAQFTAYLLLTGRFVLLPQGFLVLRSWWMLWSSMTVVLLFLLGWGGMLLYHGNTFGWVMLGFGALSYLFVVQDYHWLRGKAQKVHPNARHLQRMIGAYIAAVTAFLVVNNNLLPSFIIWLLPTIVLLPLILRWSKKYDKAALPLLDEQ